MAAPAASWREDAQEFAGIEAFVRRARFWLDGAKAFVSRFWEPKEPHSRYSGQVRVRRKGKRYFMAGMGMSELKMSHSVFHVPFDFFDTSIHLPWSMWAPSAPVIT